MASKSEFSVSKVRNAPLRAKERAYHCSESAGAKAQQARKGMRALQLVARLISPLILPHIRLVRQVCAGTHPAVKHGATVGLDMAYLTRL